MAGPLLAYAPQVALGAVETIGALRGMAKLRKEEVPTFTGSKVMAPLRQVEQMYQRGYERGLEPETIQLARQQQAMETAGMARRIGDVSGGQLSSVTSRLGALDRVRTGLGLASQDIQYRRSMMGGLAGARQMISGQEFSEAQRQYQRRVMQEQALGGALRAGLGNIGNALTYMGDTMTGRGQDVYNTYNYGVRDAADATGPTAETTAVADSASSTGYIPSGGANSIQAYGSILDRVMSLPGIGGAKFAPLTKPKFP